MPPKSRSKKSASSKAASSSNKNDNSNTTAVTATLSADKQGIRSRFAVSTHAELAEEQRLAREPLSNRSSDNGAMPYGSWFTFSSRAAAQSSSSTATDVSAYPVSFALPPSELLFGASSSSSSAAAAGKQTNDDETSSNSDEDDDENENENDDPFSRYFSWLSPIDSGLNLYEKNPAVWAQLHSVIASSKVAIIVADTRFLPFHLPLSLLHFVLAECGRRAVVALNKADLVPKETVDAWIAFFKKMCCCAFYGGGDSDEGRRMLEKNLRFVPVSCQPEKWMIVGNASSSSGDGGGAAASPPPALRRKERKGRSTKQLSRAEATSSSSNSISKSSSVPHRRGDNRLPSVSELLGGGDDDEDEEEDDEEDDSSSDDDDDRRLPAFLGQKTIDHDEREERRAADAVQALRAEAAASLQRIFDACRELLGVQQEEDGRAAAATTNKQQQQQQQLHSVAVCGHPNAGKSSIINAIKGIKCVSVSATAGHTKHKQSIPLPDEGIVLWDSPGLVMPQFNIPRSIQSVVGMTQIAQTRAPSCAVARIAQHLPVERIYGLRKVDDSEQWWSGFELCEALAIKRGFRVRGGKSDCNRAAQFLIKDAFDGKLVLFLVPPPLELAAEIAKRCFVERWAKLADD